MEKLLKLIWEEPAPQELLHLPSALLFVPQHSATPFRCTVQDSESGTLPQSAMSRSPATTTSLRPSPRSSTISTTILAGILAHCQGM